MIANDNLRIEQGDHVIMFLTDKNLLPTSNVYSSLVHSSFNTSGLSIEPRTLPSLFLCLLFS